MVDEEAESVDRKSAQSNCLLQEAEAGAGDGVGNVEDAPADVSSEAMEVEATS